MRRIGTIIHQFRRLAARLRHASALVGLLLLLSLGVLEPLACIIHCELAERAAATSHAAHGAGYVCAFMQHESTADQAHTGPAVAAAHAGSGHAMVSHASIPSERSAPGGAGQPQPFHEMALLAVMIGATTLLLARLLPHPPGVLPHAQVRPPLRPPQPALAW